MKRLVVACYDENLQWLEVVDKSWRVTVVQKGVDLPNEGREAASYFWALATLPIRSTDTIVFVQGWPFDHYHHLLERLEEPFDGSFEPLGDWMATDDHVGEPHHPSLPIADRCRDWFNVEPPKQFTFPAGAQFAIPGTLALGHPKTFYRRMVTVCSSDPESAHVMERLWPYIFKDTKEDA